MRVFIMWSGPRSKVVADRLYEFLESVVQNPQYFISTEDIFKFHIIHLLYLKCFADLNTHLLHTFLYRLYLKGCAGLTCDSISTIITYSLNDNSSMCIIHL